MDTDASRSKTSTRSAGVLNPARQIGAWVATAVGLPLLTWVLQQVAEPIGLHNVLLLYLLAAVAVGVIGGVLPAVFAAVTGFLLAK